VPSNSLHLLCLVQVMYLPAPGDHLMRYNCRWLLISRCRQSNNPLASSNVR
jgi:hypothetical protein